MSEYLIPDLNFLQKEHYFEGLAQENSNKNSTLRDM